MSVGTATLTREVPITEAWKSSVAVPVGGSALRSPLERGEERWTRPPRGARAPGRTGAAAC